jgi:hypothetical protein
MENNKFQGNPCKKCGNTERYIKKRSCVKCTKAYNKRRKGTRKDETRKYYLKNREKILLTAKVWGENNKEKVSAKNKKYYYDNQEEMQSRVREWYEQNKERASERHKQYYAENREKIEAQKKKAREENPGARAAWTAKARSLREKRVPKWADLKEIKTIYDSCPEGYHVDHIIPLIGKNVSGLHVANNLQYLTPEENLRKGNKFEPEFNIAMN